jgi:uncharacterized membrane-anchored protein
MMTGLRILIIVALQTAALGYMIYDRLSVLNSPEVITLKVKPVDPSDPFRGDYVILNYDISTIGTADVAGDDKFVAGGPVFVTLTQRDGAWIVTAVNSQMPARESGTVVLKGTVQNVYGDSSSTLRVDYGIESFFVPQGQGKAIEDERQKGDLTAEVAVASDGRSIVKSLRRADGQVMFVEGLF